MQVLPKMDPSYFRTKIFGIITEFESCLKKAVEDKVREKHGIELTSPRLKDIYPCLNNRKYLQSGLNIDLSVLVHIVKKEMSLFCSTSST